MKKKFLTFAMVVFMALGLLSITASADDTSTVTITKTLTARGLENTTFSFTVAEVGYTGSSMSAQPDIDDFTITVNKDSLTGTYTINLPTYTSVGVYTYLIEETTDDKIAGLTYTDAVLYLVVTVTDDGSGNLIRTAAVHQDSISGTKNITAFTNTYNDGDLAVKKLVTGNMGDKTKAFSVTVTFEKDSDTTVNSTISYTVGTDTYTIAPSDWGTGNTVTATFNITNVMTVTFTNIPYNVSYAVKEADYSEYTTTYSGDGDNNGEGVLDSYSETVTITNNYEKGIDTGVILDSLPYILILAVVLIGVVYLVLRRRTSDRY